MKIIGFDPGTDRIGVGIIEKKGNEIIYCASLILPIKKQDSLGKTLLNIEQEVKKQLKKHKPTIAGVESLFFLKNKTTGMSVAAARGIIIKTLCESGIEYFDIAPTTIKKFIGGSGRADKATVAKMTGLLLKINTKKMIDDESDALAIALSAWLLVR
jgi:crossover junction endodeoxyribonuclease RuvC